ncbi:MAG: hypothetical protein V6Z81_00445 [Parvularculales bacterium]
MRKNYAQEYINNLVSEGRYCVSTEGARETLGVTTDTIRNALFWWCVAIAVFELVLYTGVLGGLAFIVAPHIVSSFILTLPQVS